jgi:hypothetical protein
MGQSKPRVNISLIVLSVVIGMMGVGLFAYYLWTGINDLTAQMQYAKVPGVTELELTDTGSYTIFHEYSHRFPSSEEAGGDSDAANMEVTLTGTDGKEVTVQRASANSTYQIGSKRGYSLSEFHIETPGRYTLSGLSPDGNPRVVMFSIAHNFMGRLLKMIFSSFVVLGFPMLLSLIFLFWGLRPVLTSRKKGLHLEP